MNVQAVIFMLGTCISIRFILWMPPFDSEREGPWIRVFHTVLVKSSRDALMDPENICTTLSGVLMVISRPIYLCIVCKTRDSTRNVSNDTSTTSESSGCSDGSKSEHDTSTVEALHRRTQATAQSLSMILALPRKILATALPAARILPVKLES
jgi:hypothetical protein